MIAGRGRRPGTLFVTSPRRDFPWLKKSMVKEMRSLRAMRELARVIDIALHLAGPFKKRRLPPGLGARHAAALLITAATDAVAAVVSSSSGKVAVFFESRVILGLEKPDPLALS